MALDFDDEKLPARMRPHAFAATELVLDVLHISRQIADIDLDSLLIYLCVTEATMRPMLLDPSTPAEVLELVRPPEEFRGSISRLLVSDRLGMPRETVRRKIQQMVAGGFLLEDEEGRVRAERRFGEEIVQKSVQEVYSAVQRYDARLRQFGCAGVTSEKSASSTPFP
jgi:hypothetical protein